MPQLKCIKCGKEILKTKSYGPDPVVHCPKCKRTICQSCWNDPRAFFEDLPRGCSGCGGQWFITDLRDLVAE